MDFTTLLLIGLVILVCIGAGILWKNKHRKVSNVVDDKYNDIKDAAKKAKKEAEKVVDKVSKEIKRNV
jgi:gas vesicle protein